MTMDVDDDDDGGGGICGVDPGSVQPLLTSWVHETQSPPKQLLD